jgi:hypothetical protein
VATKIVATRKIRNPGADHIHMHAAKTLDGRVFSRAELCRYIDNGWESFYTEWRGDTARVFTRTCHQCGGIRYATTTPDGTKNNNLLNLPDF